MKIILESKAVLNQTEAASFASMANQINDHECYIEVMDAAIAAYRTEASERDEVRVYSAAHSVGTTIVVVAEIGSNDNLYAATYEMYDDGDISTLTYRFEGRRHSLRDYGFTSALWINADLFIAQPERDCDIKLYVTSDDSLKWYETESDTVTNMRRDELKAQFAQVIVKAEIDDIDRMTDTLYREKYWGTEATSLNRPMMWNIACTLTQYLGDFYRHVAYQALLRKVIDVHDFTNIVALRKTLAIVHAETGVEFNAVLRKDI